MLWIYIYYPVKQGDLRLFNKKIKNLQNNIKIYFNFNLKAKQVNSSQQNIGNINFIVPFSTQLLRRPEVKNDTVTFMEVYGPIFHDMLDPLLKQINAELEELIQKHDNFKKINRNIEIFEHMQ
jgi:hypothetical protein